MKKVLFSTVAMSALMLMATSAGSIGKCKFSEKFEELLFWR